MKDISSSLIIIAILIGVVLILWFVRKHFKKLNMPNVFLISGAVKSGKSLLAVHLAKKEYKRAVRKWYIQRFILGLFARSHKLPKKPMLYSNIPLAKIPYNRLTLKILLRQVRIPDNSVVLMDEASLIADSMLFKDKKINNDLMLFVKLFAHYTHGGKLIIDTQSISDLHFAFKRCMNSYLYIYSRTKFPFFTLMKVREMLYSEDGSMVNNSSEDIELSMRNIFLWNTTYKSYDKYCYSIFTDDLDYQVNYDVKTLAYKDNLKAKYIVSFQDFAKEINKKFEGSVIENEI